MPGPSPAWQRAPDTGECRLKAGFVLAAASMVSTIIGTALSFQSGSLHWIGIGLFALGAALTVVDVVVVLWLCNTGRNDAEWVIAYTPVAYIVCFSGFFVSGIVAAILGSFSAAWIAMGALVAAITCVMMSCCWYDYHTTKVQLGERV